MAENQTRHPLKNSKIVKKNEKQNNNLQADNADKLEFCVV